MDRLTIENIQISLFLNSLWVMGCSENVHKQTFCTISILCAGLVQYTMTMNEQMLLYYKLTHI